MKDRRESAPNTYPSLLQFFFSSLLQIYQKCLAASENTLMYPLNHRLAFPTLIAQVLSIKTELRSHVSSILGSRNKCEMMKFTRGPLKQLRSAVDQLWRYHRDVVWLGTYKPHGLEIVEGRYGALRTRLESLHERLDCWCNNASGDDDDDNFQALSGLLEAVPVLYEGASASLVVDYARAYTPARCLGQG